MLLKNIDLNFFPTPPLNYKASQDGQLCLPAGEIIYIMSSNILNQDLVSNPPVPSKFKPGDQNRQDYRSLENRADGWEADGGDDDGGAADWDDVVGSDGSGSEYEDDKGDDEDDEDTKDGIKEEEGEEGGDAELDVDDADRPEFQFNWQKLELGEELKGEEVQKGGVGFQLDQTFNEGCARQLEWSPLGAGKYRRCSLAILTTSRQVLIYQPATVVGRGLKLSMRLLDRLLDQEVPGEEAVEVSWEKLPREICWSQLCTFYTQRWGVPIFTMLDEQNEITFVHIVDDKAEVLLRTTPEIPDELSPRIINMSWSPWMILSPVEGISFLTFKSFSGMYLQKMVLRKAENKSITLAAEGPPYHIAAGMSPGYAPHAALWYDRTYNLPSTPPCAHLSVIQHDCVRLFAVTLDARKEVRILREHQVDVDSPATPTGLSYSDPLWANYLDLNFCTSNGSLVIVKVDLADLSASFLYKTQLPTPKGMRITSYEPPIPNPNPLKLDWIDILDDKRTHFLNEWRLARASCHVYGMAYLPLAGILTICYRLKPEGILEYPIKERERCTLSYDVCRSWTDMFDSERAATSVKPFTLFGVSGETFVSDIRFLVDPEEAEESFGRMEEIIAKGMIAAATQEGQAANDGSHKFADVPVNELADHLSLALFNSKDAVLLRARNDLGILKSGKIAPKRPVVLSAHAGISKLVTQTVLEIPMQGSDLQNALFWASKASRLIMHRFACLGILNFYRDARIFGLAQEAIGVLEREYGWNVAEELEVIRQREVVLNDPGNLDLLVGITRTILGKDDNELCGTCGATIRFADLMTARCERGHMFKRCALTYVIITDPNPRVCGLCSREYISCRMVEEEENAAAMKTISSPDQEPPLILMRVLFEAADTCVFCGGTFFDKEVRTEEDDRIGSRS